MGELADELLGKPLTGPETVKPPLPSNAKFTPAPAVATTPADENLITPSAAVAPGSASPLSQALLTGGQSSPANSKLTQSVNEAVPKSADDSRKVLDLQLRTGLPPGLIERNLQKIEQAAAQKNFNAEQFRSTSPVVADWMSQHPVNAAAAKDDIGNLSAIENVITQSAKMLSENITGTAKGAFSNLRSAASGLVESVGNVVSGLGGDAISNKLESSARSVSPRLGDLIDWVHYSAEKNIPNVPRKLMGGEYADQALQAAGDALNSLGERIDIPKKQRNFVTDVSHMGGGFLPYIGAELLSGGTATPLMVAGGAGAAARQPVAPGTSEADRATSVVLNGLINGMVAKVGLSRLIERLPPKIQSTALRWLTDKGLTFAEQAGVMGGMQVASNTVAKATTNPDQSLTAGLTAATSEGGVTGVMARTVLQMILGPHAAVAGATQDGLDTISEASQKSKLRQQSQAAFESLVSKMKDKGVDSVYVPVEKWTQYFQSQKLDPDQMAQDITGSEDAYKDALATGADVRIPIERYAARLAHTEHNGPMQGDMRLSPDSLTSNEILELESQQGEMEKEFTAAAKDIKDWKPSGSAEKDAYATIHDDISGQLRNRFEPKTADMYGQLFAKAFITQSLRAGRDPMQDWNQYQVNIKTNEEEPQELWGVPRAPDSAFNGDLEESLRRTFHNESYNGEPVALANKGFTQDEIGSLQKEGMADTSGKMSQEQFGRWMAERTARLNRTSTVLKQPPLPVEPASVEFRGEHSDEAKAAVQETLKNAGWDRDQALIDLGDSYEKYGVKTTNEAITALNQASIVRPYHHLFQDKRGSIEFSAPSPDGKRQFNIHLSINADLSTFIHETGHFWLERLSELAASKDATVQIVDDFNSLKNWTGSKAGEDFTEAQHEKVARGLEAYIMEGKAPTPELQGVFSRMRVWLTGIYKNLAKLHVNLNDEVRGVFNRLIATDEEIKGAETADQYRPLFETAEQAGVDAAEFKKLGELYHAAHEESVADLNSKVLRPILREREKEYRQQRGIERDKVRQQVNAEPVYQAIHFLQKGEPLEIEGQPKLPGDIKPFKLDRKAIEAAYGRPFLRQLPRGITADEGMSADQAADFFGFDSGDQMLRAIADAKPRARMIEDLTDARMREKYGDPMTDGTVPDLAQAAVHNESRAEVMMRELKLMKDKAERGGSPKQKITSLAVIKAMAQKIVSGKRVIDINPNIYRVAEASAGRRAFELARKGSIDDALVAKKQQLINHEMYRAAVDAKKEIYKTVGEMQRFTKLKVRQQIGKGGEEFLSQIDAITQQYSFAQISGKAIERNKSLLQFAQEQEALGNETVFSDRVLNDAAKTNYKELTLEHLREIRDAATNIAHLALIKGRLLAAQKMELMQDALDSIDGSIRSHNEMHPEKPEFVDSYWKDKRRKVSGYMAAHTKMEFLFDRLDGFIPIGPVWRALFKPFVDAENAENVRLTASAEELNRIFDAYTREERMLWHYNKIHVPEVDNSFNKASLLAAALNTGNKYNRDALLKGYDWSEDQLNAVLSHLDKRDWDTVQAIWDHLETYYPDIAELQKRVTGIVPKKVEADPVVTPHGTYRGGYYPLKFNSRLSFRQMVLDEKADAQTLYGQHWARAMTQMGHTKERAGSGGKPPLLSLSVLGEHVHNVVHDLTHREALIDATKLIEHPTTREAIEGAAGKEMYRQLHPWLRNIAGDRMNLHDGTEEIMQKARAGATLVNMGFKISTGVYQLSGILQSTSRIGPKYTYLGIQKMLAGVPWVQQREQLQFIFDRDESMRHRPQNYDRDARQVLAKTSISGVVNDIERSALMHIGMADMAVAAPTWLGAYMKAMDGEEPTIEKGDEEAAIEFASSMVRMTQPSAGAKDLPQIMTGPSYKQIFTLFYSFWSTTMNMMERETRMVGSRGIKDMPRFAASMSYLWILQALVGDLMVGRGPDKNESWSKWAVTHVAQFPFDAMIGLRDIAHYAANYEEGKHFDFEFTPVADAFASIGESFVTAQKALTPGEHVTKTDVKNAVMGLGYWGGFPARQMWITGSYLHDWITGKAHPTGFFDALRGLAYGPKH